MSSTYLWTIIIVASLMNFFLRAVFVEAYGRIKFPRMVEKGLYYVPAAVLSAIIAPAVLTPGGEWLPLQQNPQLWAALAAGLVAWYYKSIFRTLLVGLLVFWGLQWLGID